MAKIKVTQVRSSINRTKKQKLTLAALGLRKLGMTVEHDDTPNILGMINKVSHLVTCLLYTSPSPRDVEESRMPSSA